MSDRKHDPKGPKASAKKTADSKPQAHAKAAKATASHPKKDKQAVPFQPVLLRPQEPRAKVVEAATAAPSSEQGQESQLSSKTIRPKPSASQASSSNSSASHISQPPRPSSDRTKPPAKRTTEAKRGPEISAVSKPSFSVSSPSNPTSHVINTSESKVETRSASQIPSIKPLTSTYCLLSEFTQFQVILTEELKSFLDQTLDTFPASTSSANPLVQGEVTVIGVLGGPNTGKTTLLCALAQHASPLILPPHQPSTPIPSSPKPLSILQQLMDLSTNSQNSQSQPSLPTSATHSLEFPSKTVSSSNQTFSVDMTLMRRPNDRILENSSNFGLQQCVNASDCYILLEFQCFPTASMLSQAKRGDNTPADVRNQENSFELLSLQLGLFAASVCNVIISVDDSTTHMARWKYWKTIEMLKWGIPEISDLYHKSPSIPTLIPQLKRSFHDARQSGTYEKMIADLTARTPKKLEKPRKSPFATSSPSHNATSSPDGATSKSKSKKAQRMVHNPTARGSASRTSSTAESSAVVAEMTRSAGLTLEERSLKEVEHAIASLSLYSPEQEYLPTLMFAFNKASTLTSDMRHQQRVQTALASFFFGSSFLQPQRRISANPTPSEVLQSISFAMIPLNEASNPTCSQELDLFVSTVFQLPRPKFRKPLNPRDWLVAALWIWEIIKQSPALTQYQTVLKQSSLSGRSVIS